MKIKIFKGGTVKEELKRALRWCKKNDGHIATLKEIYDLREKKKIPNGWYETATVYYKGNVRKAKPSELEDIENFYKKGGRLLYLGNGNSGLCGDLNLNDVGRFVGVASETQKEK